MFRRCAQASIPGLIFVWVIAATPAAAGWPTSQREALPSRLVAGAGPLDRVPMWTLSPLDVHALIEEDAARQVDSLTKERRVGLPRKVALSPERFGIWENLDGGDRVWRARVQSRGALWLVLGFTTFRLPEGAELYVYAPDGGRVQGPFEADRVREDGQLWSTPVGGDVAVVELLWPASLGGVEPNLHLGVLSHGYRSWGGIGLSADAGSEGGVDAGACNIDVNCPLGDDWQDEKRGVVLTLVNGSRDCTGSMIAIAGGGECRNYVLTAHHCHGDPTDATSMSLMFNFERPLCDSGVAPTDQVLGGGGIQRATSASSDFTLIEMNDPPPAAFQPYWNGWSRSPTAATETWGIHHPANDEKKICYNRDPVIDGSVYGPDHWRITEWEEGTTEGGSSGSPLFDQNSRIVGQLHGGTASCTSITYDEYGKLSASWEGVGTPDSRLRDWLDPDGTGEMTIDGSYGPTCGAPAPVLAVAATAVDDAGGNGDGIVGIDEPFTLVVDVQNGGSLNASMVSGTLTVLTADVEVNNGVAGWPDIPASEIRTSSPPHFSLRTTPSFVCGTTIEADLLLTSSERPAGWTRRVEIPTGVETASVAFQDDMEAGAGNWIAESLAGTGPWVQSTARSSSPVTSWFVADPDVVTDQALVMEPIDPVPVDSELRFQSRVNAEGTFDGGVLEYAVAGGAWLDADDLIVEGAYTTTISTCCSNPLGGRRAWSGDNGGFAPVRVDLASLAGQNVQFRWRFGSDDSTSDEGWYIDVVVVEGVDYSCWTFPLGEASGSGGAAFTVDKNPGGFRLEWSAPDGGGTTEGYVLYRTPLASSFAASCESDLGAGTTTVLPALTDDQGFVVIARNAAGEGSYGSTSSGDPRPPASGADVCP